MTLDIASTKIVARYLTNGTDMNDSIAKYAMENNLNIEQTKRLVEESNKTCYLQKFASTGEQIFDVAQYNIVKEKISLVDKVEKTAAIKFIDNEIEKVASEEILTSEYDGAIQKVRTEIGSTLVKIYSMEKTASYDKNTVKQLRNEIDRKEKIINILIEKRAGIITGIAGGTLKAGGAVAGKVITNPGKTLIIAGTAGSFKQGVDKMKPKDEDHNILVNKTAEIEKDASVSSMFGQAEKFIENSPLMKSPLGLALSFGAVGLAASAAKAGGGIVSRMMKERELNRSFDTISAANADIRQIPNARAYFDVVARHSPDLANDPMVAPQLIRQFDTFGGVDVNTVGKLREIEAMGRKDRPHGTSGFEIAGNMLGGVKTFSEFGKLPEKDKQDKKDTNPFKNFQSSKDHLTS